ncbi:MAG TPA: rod shape-determining protein MreD [Bacilli bacterium]
MRYRFLWLVLFGLFVCDGSLFPWLIPAGWTDAMKLSPHFLPIGIMFVALYVNRHAALVYGLVFGLLQDVFYYGHMLGPHMFTLGVVGYFIGIFYNRGRITLTANLIVLAYGLIAYDLLLFGIYHFFAVTDYALGYVLYHSILPSLLINMLIALVLYVPFRLYFEGAPRRAGKDEIKS